VEGQTALEKTKKELEEGEWKKLLKGSGSGGQPRDHGTRGAGSAHFEAAAAKLLEVGHGGMLSSPRHRERKQQQQTTSSTSSSQQQQQQITSPTGTTGSSTSAAGGVVKKRPAPPPLRRIEPTTLSSSATDQTAQHLLSGVSGSAAASLAGSVRAHVHARLLLEPQHLEFAPLHRGLRYQTSINLINIGSNASRYRVKVAYHERVTDDETDKSNVGQQVTKTTKKVSTLPTWLKTDVPHVRLGPGMRAQILLEVNGHQPAGEEFLDIVVSFEGPNNSNTLTANATIRIVTIDQPQQQHANANAINNKTTTTTNTSSSSGATTNNNMSNVSNGGSSTGAALVQHQQSLCWITTTGNTVECLGACAPQFIPGTIRRVIDHSSSDQQNGDGEHQQNDDRTESKNNRRRRAAADNSSESD